VIDAVFFDVGGTILDESREFDTWADWLGIPRHTFSAVFGAVIARGLDYRETFRAFRPDFAKAVVMRLQSCMSAIGRTTMRVRPRRPVCRRA
jgi:FMN phosphatase YigB (HAD superfamily)